VAQNCLAQIMLSRVRAHLTMAAATSSKTSAAAALRDVEANQAQGHSSSQVSTAPSHGTASSSSERSAPTTPGSFRMPNDDVCWEDLKFANHIQPHRRHAHCVDDIYLLNTFLDLSKVKDIDGESIKLVLKALGFLRKCSYSAVDICSILAHASAYFAEVAVLCGEHMSATEVGHVLVTTMFIAHSYIQDETCPLHVWHRHLFKGYCSMRKISEAVMRVMAIRCYILRLVDDDLHKRNESLCGAICSDWRTPAEQVC